MAFPTSLDTFSGTTAQGTSTLSSPDHALDHRTLGSAALALETKVGLAAGSPVADRALVGSGNGTSNWTATWNNATFGSPTITGGTITGQVKNNGTVTAGYYGTATLGSATITGGTLNGTPVIGTPSITGGTVGTSSIIGGNIIGSVTATAGTIYGLTLGTPVITPSISPKFAGTTITAVATTASTSYVAVVGGTVVITPTVTSNVMLQFSGEWRNGGPNFNYMEMLKNGTALVINSDHQADVDAMQGFSMTYVDPSVAAGFVGTYSLAFKVDAGTATIAGAAVGGENSRFYAFAFPV